MKYLRSNYLKNKYYSHYLTRYCIADIVGLFEIVWACFQDHYDYTIKK